jgi:acyl-CoA synthetase (AMP-forming)/AMP-acid ligase II
MVSLPVSGSPLIYGALALLAVSLLMLIVFIAKRMGRVMRRIQRKPVRRLGTIASTMRLLFILLLITASLALLFLSAFIRSYTVFTQREFAATVRCTTVPGTEDTMTLELRTLESPTNNQMHRYLLRGQQWSIEGHILKWDDWLNFIGLRTMYKLTRVRGRYLRAEDEMNRPATVYSLVPNEDDPRWRWLYEYGPRLPFVQAVYGNTVFTFPSEGKTFDIYVTTSGFMVAEKGE